MHNGPTRHCGAGQAHVKPVVPRTRNQSGGPRRTADNNEKNEEPSWFSDYSKNDLPRAVRKSNRNYHFRVSRRRAEAALAASRQENARLEARFDLIRKATTDGLWDMEISQIDQTDASSPIWWSDRLRSILGFHDEGDFPNVLGSWTSWLHPDDAAPTLAAFDAHINDRSGRTPYDVTYRLRCRNGEYRWFSAHGTTMRASDGTALRAAGSVTDITERKEAEEKIRRLALYDTMTGLPNRTLCMDRMKQALANAARHALGLAILFIDLNRFKEINDTQGHAVGDQVLIEVARRFQTTLRGEETLARLAGDEFVVIAEATDKMAATLIAERLQQALAEPVATNGHTFSVGVSIGIAFYPEDGVTSEDMLKRADIAMYRAKALGYGYLVYQPEMSAGLAERMQIAENLSRAMKAGKLELYYQPKIHLDTRALSGAEALLRWNDPERGWISPAEFIPIAEARGMMGALGKWVLREACRQMKAWQESALHFPGRLAVNLAAQQLEEADIAENIVEIVRAAGLTPACLELELTESGLIGNVERAIEVMGALKAAGFALSIDDFGTGYSSLSYLKRLPVDTLKIDISFVRDILKAHHDYTIVTTIIGMARNLGLNAIAEGVEESEQAEALLALGCNEAQGYYFGRPEPARVFAQRWL